MRVSHIFRLVIFSFLIVVAGCTSPGSKPGIERADDLGLQLDPTDLPKLPPLLPLPAPSAPEARDQLYRDGFVEQWMARSDYLCREYKDKIILVSRNTRFATDATSTILSGLATIFTAVSTIHPLTGAATIVSGVGAAAQTDTFEQQSGEIIASAIQTARENQANQIEYNLKTYGPAEYNMYRAQRDVIDYHNMCSLETALAQVRSSLKADKPNKGETPPAAQGVLLAPPQPPVTPPTGTEAPSKSNQPVTSTPPPSKQMLHAETNSEQITKVLGMRIQAALCVTPDGDFGGWDSQTRLAIAHLPIQLVQAAQPPREVAGHGWRRRAGCRS
jgi:hypothetical protein